MRNFNSKYYKTPKEFYEELGAAIKENDSHKVLSTLLRMGFSEVNIHDIVTGKDIPGAKPLYEEAIGKDIVILQHLHEFGVIFPDCIKVSPAQPPRPPALDTNGMFAQHFIFRRTREGKEIFNHSPACSGFCYEYVRFNLTPHKKYPTEDFLDKLLREIYQHSHNFYKRIKGYQDFAQHMIRHDISIVAEEVLEKNILGVYSDEFNNAEFIDVNLQFEFMAHAVIIHKINTMERIRYQLFDPTAYDGKVLTADQLNDRFKQHIKNYEDKWGWGKLKGIYLADIGEYLKVMGHLDTVENKRPFKNVHLLITALQEKNILLIEEFIKNSHLKVQSFFAQYSVANIIMNYLCSEGSDQIIKEKIIALLPPHNLNVMVDGLFAVNKKWRVNVSKVLPLILKSENSKNLPPDKINAIKNMLPKETSPELPSEKESLRRLSK